MVVSPIVVAAAETVSQTPVRIKCSGLPDGVAGMTLPDGTIVLLPTICQQLHRYVTTGTADGRTAEAVLVLTHEAEHAAGILYETAAECAAHKDAPRLARALGHPATKTMVRLLDQAHRRLRRTPHYGDHPCPN